MLCVSVWVLACGLVTNAVCFSVGPCVWLSDRCCVCFSLGPCVWLSDRWCVSLWVLACGLVTDAVCVSVWVLVCGLVTDGVSEWVACDSEWQCLQFVPSYFHTMQDIYFKHTFSSTATDWCAGSRGHPQYHHHPRSCHARRYQCPLW